MIDAPKINLNKVNQKVIKNPIDEAVKFLRSRFKIRYNTFLNTFSIVPRKGKKQAHTVSDLRLKLRSADLKMSKTDVLDILRSDLKEYKVAEIFNPIHDFINSCKGKFKGKSHIDKLSSYINPRNFNSVSKEEHEKEKLKFQQLFKKWYVSTIATALGLTKNDVMFIIVQADGGTGKTEFTKWLFAHHEISYYIKTITKNNYKTDILREISRNILIIFDEMAALTPRYLDTFKSEISQADIKTNFARSAEEVVLPRLGSFAGTSNYNQEKGGFIPRHDNGLMRRLFTVENSGHINWQSYVKEVQREQMIAEALMLIEQKYDYTFNPEDFKYFEKYNRRYLKEVDLKNIISSNYTQGVNGESEHLSATDVQKELVKMNYPVERISAKRIGSVLTEMDYVYKKSRSDKNKQPRDGYLIVRK